MKTSVGNTSIEITTGDITACEVDAIANAANTELWMGAGVAGAIKRVGGEAIETEAMLQGPIEVGDAVVTTGHDLKARWVIHAAVMGSGPARPTPTPSPRPRARARRGRPRHARSVALPAFGTGVGGFPSYQCASIMLGETVAYLQGRIRHTACATWCFVRLRRRGRAAFRTPWPASAASSRRTGERLAAR